MGLNIVAAYIFWNIHEVELGKWYFSGDKNLAEYIRIAGGGRGGGLFLAPDLMSVPSGNLAVIRSGYGRYPVWEVVSDYFSQLCVLISMRSELISLILYDCWIFVEIINIRNIMHENNKVHKLTAANSHPIAYNQNSQTADSDTDSFGVSIGGADKGTSAMLYDDIGDFYSA